MQARKAIVIGLDAAVPTLVRRFVQDGSCPNFRLLTQEGSSGDALSCFPGVTPVNWASIITGSYPGTHGVVDFMVHRRGTPLDESEDGLWSTSLQAETIWQAAERVGRRSVTVDFPNSWPPVIHSGAIVAGVGSPASHSPFELRASSCFAAGEAVRDARDCVEIEFKRADNWGGVPPSHTCYEASIIMPPDDGSSSGEGPTYYLLLEPGGRDGDSRPCLGIYTQRDLSTKVALLRPGEWSRWLFAEFRASGRRRRGGFRFHWSEGAPDPRRLKLYCSQVMPDDGYTVPDELGRELVQRIGPAAEYCGSRGYERRWLGEEAFVEEARYAASWCCRAGEYLMDRTDGDLLFIKWHFLDHVQHTLWGRFDPLSPWYRPATAGFYLEVIRRAYQIADEMVGHFLPRCKDSVVIVVSDHGHIPHLKAVSINNLLAQKGLITWEPTDGKPRIDWSRTKALAGPCAGHIHVNLRGREPHGTISPGAEYEKVREFIIASLKEVVDPATGQHPVALAVTREEAAALGVWGDAAGDVVYLMAPGYTGDNNWFPLTEDGRIVAEMGSEEPITANYGDYRYIAPKFQSTHGAGLPSISLGEGTEKAIFYIAGPGIKRGYTRQAPLRLVDVAPTLAAAVGIPAPANCEGGVLHDVLSGAS